MPTITAWMVSALDGVVEQPERWSSPYMNEEVNAEIGAGLRLFDDTTGEVRLELVESRAYSTGVLRAGYRRADA